ncbi:uncharacterized mitochondrial protein-like protein [Tanacetum coccineum]
MEYYVYLPEEYGKIEGQRLKNKSFASIQELFDKAMKRIDDVKETTEVDEDKETAELQSLMKVIPDEEEVAVDAIPVATKPLSIVDWKILKEGKISYNQIIRGDGSSKRPEEGYERVLWGDLKTMFEHHVEDIVWRNLQGNKLLVWKLFDSCGVYFVRFQSLYVFMLVEKRYPLTPATITEMLNKKLQADHWNEMFNAAGTKVTTLKFNSIKDAKSLLEAIENKFGGNAVERISKKRTKNKAKTDKTGHEMEKRGKDKVKSKPKSEKSTEFLNKTLNAFFKEQGIKNQTSTPRTPEQKCIIERRNRTLVEAARTVLSPSKLPYTTAPSQQELELLFGPLYDEFFNTGTSSVNKSSSPANNSAKQDITPTTNIHSLTKPSTLTNVNAEENNDNQAEDAQF